MNGEEKADCGHASPVLLSPFCINRGERNSVRLNP